jgi:colicin import membrane protein
LAETTPSPTISLRERSFSAVGSEERLRKWFVYSLLLHLLFIAGMFLSPMAPAERLPMPVHVVDLVGGERIGAANVGTELRPISKQPPPSQESLPKEAPEPKKEAKKEEPQKEEKIKTKAVEKKPPAEEKLVLKEKTKTEAVRNEPAKDIKREAKEDAKSETASADSVRERLIQSAVDRAKTRTEGTQKSSKGETFSAGSGEGDGAAGLGAGGRGGPGIVKGMDFIIYERRILTTIKENWAWVGQRSDLRVVVQFGVKDNGDIVGLKIVQPSGDPSYDESVLRAVKKSSPLPAPPENYRQIFADMEITFRPRDLGA